MERLTIFDDHRKRWQINNACGAVVIDDLNYAIGAAIDRLAAYEDCGLTPLELRSLWAEWIVNLNVLDIYRKAEAEGRLIRLPCTVGDVLDLRKRDDIEADFGTVYHFDFWNDGTIDVWFETDGENVYHVDVGDFGKNVFLAREKDANALWRQKDGT